MTNLICAGTWIEVQVIQVHRLNAQWALKRIMYNNYKIYNFICTGRYKLKSSDKSFRQKLIELKYNMPYVTSILRCGNTLKIVMG